MRCLLIFPQTRAVTRQSTVDQQPCVLKHAGPLQIKFKSPLSGNLPPTPPNKSVALFRHGVFSK